MCPVVDKPADQKNAARNEPGHDGDTWWVGVGAISLGALTPLSSRSASCSPTADGSGELTCSGVGGRHASAGSGAATQHNWLFLEEFQSQPNYRTGGPTAVRVGKGSVVEASGREGDTVASS